VRSWLESEWQRLGGGALVFLPLALVFRALVAARRFLYRARILPAWRARVPVIVVGNISVGGTGKTPLVLEISRSSRVAAGLRAWWRAATDESRAASRIRSASCASIPTWPRPSTSATSRW